MTVSLYQEEMNSHTDTEEYEDTGRRELSLSERREQKKPALFLDF